MKVNAAITADHRNTAFNRLRSGRLCRLDPLGFHLDPQKRCTRTPEDSLKDLGSQGRRIYRGCCPQDLDTQRKGYPVESVERDNRRYRRRFDKTESSVRSTHRPQPPQDRSRPPRQTSPHRNRTAPTHNLALWSGRGDPHRLSPDKPGAQSNGHRSDTTCNISNVGALVFDHLKIDITDVTITRFSRAVWYSGLADVDYDCTLFHHVRGDELCPANGHNQDVRACAQIREISCSAVREGDRRVAGVAIA